MRADHDRHAAEAYVALFFLPLYLLTLKGFSTADDLTHYDLVQNIVGSGHLYLPPWKYDPETHPGMRLFAARGTDGHVYLGLPNGLAFASVPLGALGRAADGWVGSPSAPDPLAEPGEDGIREAMHRLRQRPSAILTAAINPVVTAITVALFFGLALQIARSVRDSLQVTLLLGLATVVWPYSTTYWTQPIAGLFLLAAFYMLCRTHQGSASRDALAGGLLAGGAFLCRYDTLPLASWLLALASCAPGRRR